ncbi:MAG: FAD-dependent oxidoreductase [Bacteroidota bacterium]
MKYEVQDKLDFITPSGTFVVVLLIYILLFSACQPKSQQVEAEYDIIIFGATFSGIASALSAAEFDHKILIVEEHHQIGGLMTSGLSFTDFISYESLGGIFLDYTKRVEQYYVDKYGVDSKQVKDCHHGIHAEPHVTLNVFRQMLSEFPNIHVKTGFLLRAIESTADENGQSTLNSLKLLNSNDSSVSTISGRVFIDATYEGDLAVMAGASYRIGRESRQDFGEFLAGHLFYQYGRILPGSSGQGDRKVQGYNFRLIMTDDSLNRKRLAQPKRYDRSNYLSIADVLREEKVSSVFVEKGNDGLFRTQMLPNRKADINDIKNAPVRMAMLGKNYAYPDGDRAIRKQIVDDHLHHILGMIYFVQNDSLVPIKYRKQARKWGLAKDEFVDNDNLPPRLYIREARRVDGHYFFTQNDVNTIPGSLITEFKADGVAIGDYAMNCHGVAPASLHPDVADGDFNYIPAPFQIPLGVILPKSLNNLLVSVAVSASHVGFSGIRLEPTWTALGQAAGVTAHLALTNDDIISDVQPREVQQTLHQQRAKTIYISDIDEDSEYFEAAQYLGMKGFMHDIYLMDTVKMRGVQTYQSIRGTQYAYAYPFHELKPEVMAEDVLIEKWLGRIEDLSTQKILRDNLSQMEYSRGDLLLETYQLLKSKEK